MDTLAVVIEEPERLSLRRLTLKPVADDDLVVEVRWSGISTGTERLLWSGRMPPFPGMGYPLVPGYESVGRVIDAGAASRDRIGQTVFVPGSSGFEDARGLFGGAARRLVVGGARAPEIAESLGDQGVLIALAAILPAAVASLNGVQFQSECSRLADRSEHMVNQLRQLEDKAGLARLRPVRILDALRLGEDIAQTTIDEVAEWSAIYGKDFIEI